VRRTVEVGVVELEAAVRADQRAKVVAVQRRHVDLLEDVADQVRGLREQ
jgi:hypothetical protein